MLRLFLIVGTMWNWAALTLFQRNMPPYSGYKSGGTLNTDGAPVYQIKQHHNPKDKISILERISTKVK